MILRIVAVIVCVLLQAVSAAPLPPLVCPAGGPVGSVDLRVASARGTGAPLPLRTINRLDEGDTLLYKPLLRSGEKRKGEVTLVLVPTNPAAAGEKLLILEPKNAEAPQQWKVPWRVSVVAFVYGPSGLSTKKVRNFLSRDNDLVSQLADYAEKTSQTEALISALSSPSSSSLAVQSALQGFASQYGLSVQIDRNAPPNQQAMTLFRTLNPAMASYDPISPQGSQQVGETARLATSVATLFFGSPVGLAAGGTAMLLELRSMAFPKAEFRSALSQSLPDEGLGLCGRRDPAPPHTRIAYLWASRVPNIGPPQLSIEKANSLPAGLKSPVPVSALDTDWKYVDRCRDWTLQAEDGKQTPIHVEKLTDKSLEMDLSHVKPGTYHVTANWDWDRFPVGGTIQVRPLADLSRARVSASSRDLLVGKAGKVPITLENSDFEFVTKVEVEKANDKFAKPAPVPFLLPQGIREGPQDHLDVQVNTIDLDPGTYHLLISQVDGKAHTIPLKVLAAPPVIENLPVVLNQGSSGTEFTLKGERLDLLTKIESGTGSVELGPAVRQGSERSLRLQIPTDLAEGTSLAIKAYMQDRTQPLTFADAVRIVGPRPRIIEIKVARHPDAEVQLAEGELPGGLAMSAIVRGEHLQSNSVVRLTCGQPGSNVVELRLGQRSGSLSLQRLAPDQLFVSFDTSAWLNGCELQAMIANGTEGASDWYSLGRIVRVPQIEKLEVRAENRGPGTLARATLVGQNLETIERIGWTDAESFPMTALPIAIASDSSRQSVEVNVAPPLSTEATLQVWLRGESQPRSTRVRPVIASVPPPAEAPAQSSSPGDEVKHSATEQ